MFHNDNHEGFDTFLQFPDFFFNKCRFLDQLNGSFVSTGRRNTHLAYLDDLDSDAKCIP